MIEPFQNSLILTGPTASGKSALALELAERLKAEIISADSMTVYRGMDIGTAKPSAEDQQRIPHHLVDELDPWESASVAWWLKRAAECVRDIESRGRRAMFVGGTPLYLKALLCGLFDGPPRDADVRARLEHEAATTGNELLHARLAAVDPASAGRLHSNDVRRVVRALEVWELSGKPLGEWQQQGWWGDGEPAFGPEVCFALDIPRPILYDRIDTRVRGMFDSGWVEEVRRLADNKLGWSREASMALGYREIREHLSGGRSLADTILEVQLRTRQFAKRQLTWFRGLAGVRFATAKEVAGIWATDGSTR
ncbi:tRNA (adenosine(37)-N6)-dimethylallyltransferase MiaA [Zavarzinella formosa]|uniref:tRNA (adenosine(37)-N6)-dimethylallyltransferase MiaA n=1 Tax=Zavarzinella formosa TaxID=360055 RepID=UPI0002D8226A|nr:tRNA (adenosine(37)-N6)-dimethylallyltransferase MiaA [Zavarzinella formosa]